MITVDEDKVTFTVEVESLAIPTLDVRVTDGSADVVAVSRDRHSPHTLLVDVSFSCARQLAIGLATGSCVAVHLFTNTAATVGVSVLHNEFSRTVDNNLLAVDVCIANVLDFVYVIGKETGIRMAKRFILFASVGDRVGCVVFGAHASITHLHADLVVASRT